MPDCIDPDGHCGQCAREGEPECCICGNEFPPDARPPLTPREKSSRGILVGAIALAVLAACVVFFLYISTTSLVSHIHLPTK